METLCDNTSVGVILENQDNDIVLLGRARFPFGLAPVAGHIDDHGSAEQAGIEEVFEEVGLRIVTGGLEKLIDNRRIENSCRRKGGDYHDWTVFRARTIGGLLTPSQDETHGAGWVSRAQLQVIADSSRNHVGEVQPGAQLLEPIWLDLFTELGYVEDTV